MELDLADTRLLTLPFSLSVATILQPMPHTIDLLWLSKHLMWPCRVVQIPLVPRLVLCGGRELSERLVRTGARLVQECDSRQLTAGLWIPA